MDDNNQDPQRLKFVLLVVLILCGGNGAGIIAAALVWKSTGLLWGAILTLVGITLLAFLGAIALILSHTRKRKNSAGPSDPAPEGK